MTRNAIWTVAIFVLLVALHMHSNAMPEPRNHPTILHLKQKNRTVTIKAGPNQALYSIVWRSGKKQTLSLAELKTQIPDLYRLVKTALAEDTIIDARLDPQYRSLKKSESQIR